MGQLIVTATVPLLSVLIGAALTYWLNVKARQRDNVLDTFNQAITAVAVADASQHYISDVAKPRTFSEDDHREVLREIAKVAIEGATLHAGEARAALAKVYQYEPGVKRYYEDASAVVDRPSEIIAYLVKARDEHIRQPRKQIADPDHLPSSAATVQTEQTLPFGMQFMTKVNPQTRSDTLSTGPGLDDDEIY